MPLIPVRCEISACHRVLTACLAFLDSFTAGFDRLNVAALIVDVDRLMATL